MHEPFKNWDLSHDKAVDVGEIFDFTSMILSFVKRQQNMRKDRYFRFLDNLDIFLARWHEHETMEKTGFQFGFMENKFIAEFVQECFSFTAYRTFSFCSAS